MMILIFYQEENNSTDKYKTAEGFSNYEVRKKIIKVKDSTDIVMNVK
jgi:penicillin amidase